MTPALEDTAARLRLLRLVAEAANAADSVEEAAGACIDVVRELTGWSLGHFCVCGPDRQLRSSGVWRSDDPDRYQAFQEAMELVAAGKDGGLPGRVLEQGRAVTIVEDEPDAPPELLAVAARAGIRGAYAFPVWVRDEIVGVVEFFSTHGRPVDEAALEVLEQVGTQLGRVVERQRHLTELEVAERELQLAFERERGMVTQLMQLDRNKADFMSMISHELRTPLTSIVGYLDLLTAGHGGPLTERQSEMLAVVERNAQRLLELIDDIVTLDRLESGRLPLELGAVDVTRLVDQVVEAVTPLAAARGQHLTADRRSGVGSVEGDAAQLERVLLNLATNAVKFTPRDGVVSIVADGDADGVRLTVVDTGMGIPTDEQSRIFTRFFRSSTARANSVPGTGLGLVIARSIVEAHGGAIELVSAEGEGTVVTVTLPRTQPGGT